MAKMEDLSDELLLALFNTCTPKLLVRCSEVNKRWCRLAQDDLLWRRFYRKRFGWSGGEADGRSWKSRFALAYRWSRGHCQCRVEQLPRVKEISRHQETCNRIALEMRSRNVDPQLEKWVWQACQGIDVFAADGSNTRGFDRLAVVREYEIALYQRDRDEPVKMIEVLRFSSEHPAESIALFDNLLVAYGQNRLIFWRIRGKHVVHIATLRSLTKSSWTKVKVSRPSGSFSLGTLLHVSVGSISSRTQSVLMAEIEVCLGTDPLQNSVRVLGTASSESIYAPKSNKRSHGEMRTGDRIKVTAGQPVDFDFHYPWVVVGKADNTIKVYSMPLHSEAQTFMKSFLPLPPADLMGSRDRLDQSLKLYATLSGHTAAVTSVCIRHGKCVSAAKDGTIRIWNLGTANVPSYFHTSCRAVTVSTPKERAFGSAGDQKRIITEMDVDSEQIYCLTQDSCEAAYEDGAGRELLTFDFRP